MKTALLFAFVGTLGAASWAQTSAPVEQVGPNTFRIPLKNIKPNLMAYWLDPVHNPAPEGTIPLSAVIPPGTTLPFGKPVSLTDNEGTAPAQNKRTYKVTLKNVKPSLMAYWLDPEHNSVPPEFSSGTREAPLPTAVLADDRQVPSHLPAGVDKLVAVDPQNALLAFGTEGGVAQLATTLETLDKPLRQIEVEGQFIRLSSKDAERLIPPADQAAPLNGLKRADAAFMATLNDLEKQQKAQVITAPRIIAFNTMTARMNTSVTNWVKLQPFDAKGHIPQLPSNVALYTENHLSLEVQPTLEKDGTITLRARGGQDVQLRNSDDAKMSLVLEDAKTPEANVNVRDGENIAVLLNPTAEQLTKGQRLLLLLTTHIVRRHGE